MNSPRQRGTLSFVVAIVPGLEHQIAARIAVRQIGRRNDVLRIFGKERKPLVELPSVEQRGFIVEERLDFAMGQFR